jgi:hypothetical protein
MNPLNRVAGYIMVAGLLTLSACVIAPDRGYGPADPHRQGTDNRHDEGERHCNSDEERRSDGCRDVEHH